MNPLRSRGLISLPIAVSQPLLYSETRDTTATLIPLTRLLISMKSALLSEGGSPTNVASVALEHRCNPFTRSLALMQRFAHSYAFSPVHRLSPVDRVLIDGHTFIHSDPFRPK